MEVNLEPSVDEGVAEDLAGTGLLTGVMEMLGLDDICDAERDAWLPCEVEDTVVIGRIVVLKVELLSTFAPPEVIEVPVLKTGLLVVAKLGMRATGVGPRVLTVTGGVGRIVKRGGVKEPTPAFRTTGTLAPEA